ncbi:MAG TPA: Ig-like domain-containing protein [Anaerolineaceae bacterium]
MSPISTHSSGKGFWLLSVFILIGLLAGLACNVTVPGPSQPTPEPTALPTSAAAATPTSAPKPTQVPQNLPAALVETAPLPKSEIGLKQPFIFYFNQPMEKGSVEAALQAQPALTGAFKWLNDFTVSFTPDQPLPKDTAVLVTLSTKARAANGQAMTSAVELLYHTASGFQAVTRLPLPDVDYADPSAAVVATFDHPIVPLGGDSSQTPAAFTLEPAATGRGEWLNTSTYIFYPDPGLAGGKKYTVHLNQDLTSTDGMGWASTPLPDWSFSTLAPQVSNVSPDDLSRVFLDAPVVITFNVGMDTASVAQNFSIKGPDGQPAAGKTTWNSQATEMTFQPDSLLQRAAVYSMSLSGKAQARGGTPLGKDLSWKLTTVPAMAVAGTDLAAGSPLRITNGFGTLRILVTSPLPNSPDFTKYISLEPAVDNFSANAAFNGTDIYLSGIFAGRTDYTLHIKSDLADKWGQKLKEEYVFKFKTGALAPSLTANIVDGFSNVVFLTPNETAIPAQATNIKNLTIGYGGISLVDFAAAAEISPYDRLEKFQGPRLATFNKTPGLPTDKSVSLNLPLTPDGKGLQPGLYYYVAQSPEVVKPNPTPGPMLLVVSKVHLTMKVSANEILVWAVDLDSNQPVSGAKVTIYQDDKGSLSALGDLTTDGQGLGKLAIPDRSDPYIPLYAVIGKPLDSNFSLGISSWSSGLGAWDFGISTNPVDNQPMVYLYSDRPIYRPGQTMDFRAILRQQSNGRYTLSDLNKLTLRVFADYDPQTGDTPLLATIPLNLRPDYGSGSGSFVLPDGAKPGYYHMDVVEVKNATLNFQVADYRKPEIDLSVDFAKSEQLARQDVTASVKAQYYFGAPAGNLDFDWTLTSNQTYFNIPGAYQTGWFDPNEFMPSWYLSDFGFGSFIANGSGTTNPDGSSTITFPAAILEKSYKGNIQDIQLEVTLRNQGDFPVSARAHITLHPADYYIGIKPDSWSGQAKQKADFSILTVYWQQKPSGNRALYASFAKAAWQSTPGWTPLSNQPAFTVSYTEVANTNFNTDNQGAARIAFTPPSAGTYLVTVNEGDAQSQVFFWVGGEGSVVWPALPNQQIRLTADGSDYLAGQTAKLFIPNPLGENTLALITVERSKVMQSNVVAISGSNYEYDLPLAEEDAPNIYVSVILLGKGDKGQPDFRVGYLQLTVKPAAELLNVELTSQPAQVQPAGDVKFAIKVTDSQGKPVQGEFSLSVVDKAVLALADTNAPDIVKAFYDPQPLGVTSSMSLSVSGSRLAPVQPGGRGGGGGSMAAPPSVRQNFADTAYWSGAITTDANGAAEVSIKLPDNLTTWVITLRGLTKDTRVGEAVKQVVASKDLLIRPVTPRFLVAGDHIELAAMVHNNTSNTLAVDVSLQATGVDLDDPTQAGQKVNVAANTLARVTWWVKVQDIDKVDLLFSAQSGDLQDAARPDLGSVPVKTYSTPQSYGTSGILAEAGEKLEVVSIPRSFTPTGGNLRIEMAPSLAAAILDGLKAMDTFPSDFTEPVLSRLLPNLETYVILQNAGLDVPNLKDQLTKDIQDGLKTINAVQNKDGGWGWAAGHDSDPYLSAYVLYGLGRASQAGVFVDTTVLAQAQKYVQSVIITPGPSAAKGWELDRLAFQVYALQVSGAPVKNAGGLYGVWQSLSPWAKAMLALTLDMQTKGDEHAKEIVSDLESKAVRSSSGAYWETTGDIQMNYASENFTSAVVLTALAHFDPASTLLADAVRYLVAHRLATGSWSSSYESAWVLLALGDTLQGTGDLQASFAFSASLNGSPMLTGQAGGVNALTPVEASVPLSSLDPANPNALKLVHEAGTGRLYYRAFLQVDRPVESAQPLQQGISIQREYFQAGQDCLKADCQPVSEVHLGDSNPTLLVRLSISVPHDMNSVVVEDFIPAGAEIVNLTLKTSQQVIPGNAEAALVYDPKNPFLDGWGGWFFSSPVIYDDHIRWVASTLPAGTYQLTYRLTPLQAGEYRLIPAHAYQFYFPDVEGTTAGAVFKILP